MVHVKDNYSDGGKHGEIQIQYINSSGYCSVSESMLYVMV